MAGWWVGVPAAAVAADAHLLEALDCALDGPPDGPPDQGDPLVDWVQTHVDRSGAHPVVTASWHLRPDAGDTAHLADGWSAALGSPVRPAAAVPTGARVVRFPGSAAVPIRVTVADLVATTALDRVVGIGSPVLPDDVVDTVDGYLRPVRHPDGVELLVDPAGPGTWRPVEISSPHECCGGH